MKGQQMDRERVKAMQDDLAKAVVDVAQKYGMRINKNAARYSTLEAVFTIGMIVGDAVSVMTEEKAKWEQYCGVLGMKPGDFGREFSFHGKTYIITGVKPNGVRYRVKACLKGTTRSYKFNERDVKHGLPPVQS